MPWYRVIVHRMVYQKATEEVEADDPDDARDIVDSSLEEDDFQEVMAMEQIEPPKQILRPSREEN